MNNLNKLIKKAGYNNRTFAQVIFPDLSIERAENRMSYIKHHGNSINIDLLLKIMSELECTFEDIYGYNPLSETRQSWILSEVFKTLPDLIDAPDESGQHEIQCQSVMLKTGDKARVFIEYAVDFQQAPFSGEEIKNVQVDRVFCQLHRNSVVIYEQDFKDLERVEKELKNILL